MSVNFNNYPGKFTRLVLSGGGPKGLASLGALHYVHENGGLDGIQEYWGTSIGSLIAALLYVGYTPFEAFHQFFMLNGFVQEVSHDVDKVIENEALCSIQKFGEKVKHFLMKKLPPDFELTFFNLYQKFNKKIHIIGTNTDTMSGECFSVDTDPFMNIIDALEISCDLPYIFTKKNYNGQTYVDGGFINNYAANLADDNIHYCLGIYTMGNMAEKGNDYIGWIYRLLHIPLMELYRDRISRLSNKFTNLELIIDGVSIIDISPTNKKKIEVFSTGYKQAQKLLREMEISHLEHAEKFDYTEDITGDEWDF